MSIRLVAPVLVASAFVGCGHTASGPTQAPSGPDPEPAPKVRAKPYGVLAPGWVPKRKVPNRLTMVRRVAVTAGVASIDHANRTTLFFRRDAGLSVLMRSDDGATPKRTPMPAMTRNATVRIGTDSAGRAVAITGGCDRRGDCRLRVLDLATGEVRRLPIALPPGRLARQPLIERGVVTFARAWGRRSAIVSVPESGGATRRIFTTRLPIHRFAVGPSAVAVLADGDLWLYRPGGRAVIVARSFGGEEGGDTVLDPEIRGHRLYWGVGGENTGISEPTYTSKVERRDLRTGATSDTVSYRGSLDALSVDGESVAISYFPAADDREPSNAEIVGLFRPRWR